MDHCLKYFQFYGQNCQTNFACQMCYRSNEGKIAAQDETFQLEIVLVQWTWKSSAYENV